MSFRYRILIFLIFAIYLSKKLLPSLFKKKENQNQPQETQEEEKILNPPKFSHTSGFYPEDFSIKLTSEENTKIF